MQTQIITVSGYSNPVVEGYIQNFEAELTDYASLQAHEDAMNTTDLSEHLFNIKVKNHVQGKTQAAIDFLRQTLLVAGTVHDAREVDELAEKKSQELTGEINER